MSAVRIDTSEQTIPDQATLWNGRAGRAWVDAQELLDQMLLPFETMLTKAVSEVQANNVLDVGCGTGSTTLALARLPAARRSVGIDISEPMIALARQRAAREGLHADFIAADA